METKVMIYVYAVISILYALVEGVREAYYYDESVKKRNIHWLYFMQRGMFAIFLLALTNIFIVFFFVFVFSFFHNGAYYWTRNYLNKNIYPRRFVDYSSTSTALLEFNFAKRLIMAIAGLFFIVLNSVYS